MSEREPIVGIYAGSFDPITRGHMGIICESLVKLDKLIILLAVNPDKKGSMFTIEDRRVLIKRAIEDFVTEVRNNPNASAMEKEAIKRYEGVVQIQIDAFKRINPTEKVELTIDYAIAHKARQLIRGLRPIGDFDQEQELAEGNRCVAEERQYAISTTFFPTPDPRYIFASSTLIKTLARAGIKKSIEKYLYPSTSQSVIARVEEIDRKEQLGLSEPTTLGGR